MSTAPGSADVFDSFGGDGPDGPPRGGGHVTGYKKPRRGRRAALIVLIILLVLGLIAGGGFWWLMRSYDNNIERFGNPFSSIPDAERPTDYAPEAMNILLLGSDSRISAGDAADWVYGAQRTDAIMIMHIPADRSGAQVISIPRDSWVDVPGKGKNKINAAFSYGGPTLMVKTVEQLTDVRIDHVAIVDFTGFAHITDALGGVTITVPDATGDMRGDFKAGTQVMNGDTALRYVRQRYNLPGGDFDRVKRQQNWIRAVISKAVSKGTLSNPLKVNDVLSDLTKSLSTDDDFTISEMRSLAVDMRNTRADDVKFLTAPLGTPSTGRSPDGKQSIVLLDPETDAVLWKAIAQDKMADYIAKHQGALLGTDVR